MRTLITLAAALLLTIGGHEAAAQVTSIGKFPGQATNSKANPGLASGSHSGFYIRLAEDMAGICAKGASGSPFRLNVIATEGGLDSVRRLRNENEVQLAVVQSDLSYFAKLSSDSQTPFGRIQDDERRKVWAAMTDDVRLVLPLYQEKIHIVVRPYSDAKKGLPGKDEFKNLMGLLRSRARVNLGTYGSGTMITCAIIEQLMLNEMKLKGQPASSWQPRHFPAEVALDRLVAGDDVDAVILVGGVPFPALDKFGLNMVRSGLFNKTNAVAELALLPMGDDANNAFDHDKLRFPGYIKTQIDAGAYEFLTNEREPVDTRGIMSCLVTHRSYSSDGGGDAAKKLGWVKHALTSTLVGLDGTTTYDLAAQGTAAELWREVRGNIGLVQRGDPNINWGACGWNRHADKDITALVDKWSTSEKPTQTNTPLINPLF